MKSESEQVANICRRKRKQHFCFMPDSEGMLLLYTSTLKMVVGFKITIDFYHFQEEPL